MALTVTITGGMNIDQGDEVTLNATVMDADGNTPVGTLQYAWSTSRGSFIGTTNEATATYHADFTDSNDVDVVITCDVTRPADADPSCCHWVVNCHDGTGDNRSNPQYVHQPD